MLKKIAIAALLSALVSPVMAADSPIYVGFDVGSSKVDDLDGRKTSVGGFVGYQFNSTFAVEGAYRKYASYKFYNVDVDLNQTAISLVSTLPISNGFSIFGRLGYNELKASASSSLASASATETGALIGIGAGYEINKNVNVRLELQRPASDSTNISVGVAYKF